MRNISATQDLLHYLLSIFLALLYVMSFRSICKIDKTCYVVMVTGFLLAVAIPYSESVRLLADLHILLAYIGFVFVTSGLLVFLFRYRAIRPKVADRLIAFFTVCLFGMFGIYLYYQGVNGLVEIIYFTSLTTVSFILMGENVLE